MPDVTNDTTELTLRDRFALAALSGLLAWSPATAERNYDPEEAAAEAYEFADAMLARRGRVEAEAK